MEGEKTKQQCDRSKNWTKAEEEQLIEHIRIRQSIIESAHSTEGANRKKNNAWLAVMNSVNAVGGRMRSVSDGKVKWKNIRMACKKKAVAQKKSHGATGGGPSTAPDLTETEQLVVSMIPRETLFGIKGGTDTFSQGSSSSQVRDSSAAVSTISADSDSDTSIPAKQPCIENLNLADVEVIHADSADVPPNVTVAPISNVIQPFTAPQDQSTQSSTSATNVTNTPTSTSATTKSKPTKSSSINWNEIAERWMTIEEKRLEHDAKRLEADNNLISSINELSLQLGIIGKELTKMNHGDL